MGTLFGTDGIRGKANIYPFISHYENKVDGQPVTYYLVWVIFIMMQKY